MLTLDWRLVLIFKDKFAKRCAKYIEFRDDLPKSNVGKILRRELRSAN